MKSAQASAEQRAAALIRHLRADGLSFGRIAHALNRTGLPGKNGGRWYGTSVRTLLKQHNDGARPA